MGGGDFFLLACFLGLNVRFSLEGAEEVQRIEHELSGKAIGLEGVPMSRRAIPLLRTAIIGGATFAAARSATTVRGTGTALQSRSATRATEQRSRKTSRLRRLPPHRYPGYYPLHLMVVEKIIADRTVLAGIKFLKAHSRKR
jgi:hypothetical protein